MSLYNEDWSGNADLASPPAGHTHVWNTSGRAFTVRGPGHVPAGAVGPALTLVDSGIGGYTPHALLWDAPGSFADGDFAVRYEASSTLLGQTGYGAGVIAMRVSTSGSNKQGYALHLTPTDLELRTWYGNGLSQVVQSMPFVAPSNGWVGVRFKTAGTRLRAVAWLATDPWPTIWPIDVIHDPAVVGGIAWSAGHAAHWPGIVVSSGQWYDRAQLGTGTDVPYFRFPEAPPSSISQELIIYEPDDVTPEWTFSTDPTAARPYLMPPTSWSDTKIDPLQGTGSIGQANLRLLDKRTDAADQATGYVTSILFDANGENQVYNRRALWRQGDGADGWDTLFDGVIGDITLEQSRVAYTVPLRDTAERGRKVRAFVKAYPTSVLPISFDGPGNVIAQPQWLANGLVGDGPFSLPANMRMVTFADEPWAQLPDVLWDELTEEYFKARPVVNADGAVEYRFTDVAVEWYDGGVGPKTIFENMLARTDISIPGRVIARRVGTTLYVFLTGDALSLPGNGTSVYIRIFARRPPSEKVPFVLMDTTFGQLLKDLYDGTYSERAGDGSIRPTDIRYDLSAIDALPEMGWPCRLIKPKAEDDLRAWVAKHIYSALNLAPAVIDGLITPVRCSLPDDSTPILALDEDNVSADGWSWVAAGSKAINKVTVKYHRYFQTALGASTSGSLFKGPYQRWTGRAEPTLYGDATHYYPASTLDQLGSSGVEAVTLDVPSAAAVGEKELVLDLDTVSALGRYESLTGEWVSDYWTGDPGAAIAARRAVQTIRRFRYGATTIVVRARRGDPDVRAARLGDWVRLQLSWLPNPFTHERGCDVLAQIVRAHILNSAWVEFELLDAGPWNSPYPPPTFDTVTEADGVLTIPFATLTAGAGWAIEIATAASLPAADDPLWLPALQSPSGPTPVMEGITQALPNGTYWIRARSEATGRVSSAWEVYGSSVVILHPADLLDAALVLDPITGIATVPWEGNAATAAVRIKLTYTAPPSTGLSPFVSYEYDTVPIGQFVFGVLPMGAVLEAELLVGTGFGTPVGSPPVTPVTGGTGVARVLLPVTRTALGVSGSISVDVGGEVTVQERLGYGSWLYAIVYGTWSIFTSDPDPTVQYDVIVDVADAPVIRVGGQDITCIPVTFTGLFGSTQYYIYLDGDDPVPGTLHITTDLSEALGWNRIPVYGVTSATDTWESPPGTPHDTGTPVAFYGKIQPILM